MLALRRAAPARRPRVRGAAPARNLASSRSRRPASEAPCEAARLRLAAARDAIHRRASIRMRARRACPSERLPATLRRSARASANNTGRLASGTTVPCHARRDGTRPRRMRSTPATLRPPRAGGVAPRHSRSGAPRACSGRGMRFRPPPQRRDRCLARGARGPSERSARRLRPKASHRDSRDHQLVGGPRRGREGHAIERGARVRLIERTLGIVDAPDQEEAPDLEMPRMRGVHPVAVLFERRPRRVERLRAASRGRARRARSRPRRRRTARAPRPLSDRRHAPHVAGAPSHARDRRAAPSRCREARARGVVAQGDPLQCAEGITRGERTRRGGDQRVHRNPVTLVTLTRSSARLLDLSHHRRQPKSYRETEGEKSNDEAHDRDT